MYLLSARSQLCAARLISRGLCSESVTSKPEYRRLCNRLVPLPAELVKAVETVIVDQNRDALLVDGDRLHAQLLSKHEPIETREIQERAKKLQREMFGTKLSQLDEDERSFVEPQIKQKIVKKLKWDIYHWSPTVFDFYGSLCYLVGRLPFEYAALRNVFKEIKLLDPFFRPQTCLDFGSGVGSVYWIMKENYEECFKEYYSVELQRPMRDLARQVAAGGKAHGAIPLEVYTQRAKLPASTDTKYDITVSAFSLIELPNSRERLVTVETLWNKTTRHLIIVENGNRTGFRLVSEARKFILGLSKQEGEVPAYVFAPCTHNLPCRRELAENTVYPCSFPVKFSRFESLLTKRGVFSYVILSKVKPKVEMPAARIIENVRNRTSHVICQICTSKGEVLKKILTKRKHSKEVYSASRRAEWGDIYPYEDVASAEKTKE